MDDEQKQHRCPKPEPAQLTIEEACLVLRISKSMLYSLIRSGELRTVKIGRRRYVRSEAIKQLLDKMEEKEGA